MSQIFSANDNALFFRLLLSHLLIGFIQPAAWVHQKRHQSSYLYRHSFIAGVLAYVLAGSWSSLWLVGFVSITQGLFNYLKSTYESQQPLYTFLVSQAAHVFVLIFIWLLLTDNWINLWKLINLVLTNYSFMAVLSGYVICTKPVGYIVGIATAKWQRQLFDVSGPADTLEDAGKWIGIAERIVIFSFVLVSQYEAIGFLIAAKSLLRFREGDKAAKQSEYVLVGTLLSYALAILIGLLIKLTIE